MIDIKCEFKKEDTEVKKHIKTFAAVCSLAMVFSIFSATAMADETNVISVDQEYIEANEGYLPKTSHNYILVEDITVDKSTQITENNAIISLDLNGKSITYSAKGSMYIVGKVSGTTINAGNVNLTIGDSAGDGIIQTSDDYKGGGSDDHWISAGSASSTANRGGCILVQNSSTFTLTGGTIKGFKAGDEGGGIHVSNGAKFYMTGGKITGCSAKSGGGFSVHTSSGGRERKINGKPVSLAGEAHVSGGIIEGNTATNNGGGIRAYRGDLYLSNCVITNNTCEGTDGEGGGGIMFGNSVDHPQFIEFSGNVQIIGNSNGNDANKSDLYFGEAFEASVNLNGDLDPASNIVFGSRVWKDDFEFFKINGHSYDPDSIRCALDTKAAYYDSASDSIKVKDVIDPSFKYYGVSISGDIVLNTKIDLGTFANDDTSVTYEYTYTKKGTPTTVTKTLSFSDLQQDGDLYMFSVPVESACMTAPIKMTINYNNGSTVDNGDGVTIEEYAKDVINGNYGQDVKDIAEALIIYGGYAQVQLGINTDKLPTVDGVNFSQPYADNIEGAAYALDKDTNSAYYGSTVSFLSETCVKLYFKKAVLGDEAPAMTVSCSSTPIQATTSGSYYVYTIYGYSGHGFLANQYDVSFDFSIGDDISGTYSIGTYLKLVKYSSSASSAMKNLAEAYYNFAKKCEALNVM